MNKGSEIDPDMDARAKECLRLYLAGDFEPSELIFGRPPPADENHCVPKCASFSAEAESITLTAADTNEFGITTYRYNVCFSQCWAARVYFGMNSDGKISAIQYCSGARTSWSAKAIL